MFEMLKKFFLFLIPIVRTAAVRVAADELAKLAYSPAERRRKSYSGHNRLDPEFQEMVDYATKDAEETIKPAEKSAAFGSPNYYRDAFEELKNEDRFHDVLMVAFDVSGPNAALTHEWLHAMMPVCGQYSTGHTSEGGVVLDSWWVANDERFDRSDCDSAVFVRKGEQKTARGFLRRAGLVD